jgi:hypothetical protein
VFDGNDLSKFTKSDVASFMDVQPLEPFKAVEVVQGARSSQRENDTQQSMFSGGFGFFGGGSSSAESAGGLSFESVGTAGGGSGASVAYKQNNDGYIYVDSSNLKAVKYDDEEEKLNVKFMSGSEYQYDSVPESKFNSLLTESSHGRYFYWNIRGAGVPRPFAPPYPYHKV